MMVLVACEESQVVTTAFRYLGHQAYSFDLLPTRGLHPEWHRQKSVTQYLNIGWDMMIAFPPCTYLTVSGNRWLTTEGRAALREEAVEFFLTLWNAPIPRICIENPVGIMSTILQPPDQYIQPYQFGHPESKKTGLWLKGLPPLRPTNLLSLPPSGHWVNQTPSGQNKLGPSPDRARLRSQTYQGIADAMAAQWGGQL